jgi:hypothetical protein
MCWILGSDSGDYEVYFLGSDAVQSGKMLMEFRRNVRFQGRRVIQSSSNLLFEPEDGRSTFLRNVGKFLTEYR